MKTLVERPVAGFPRLRVWEPPGGGRAHAVRVEGSPLDPGWTLPDALPPGASPKLILASGTLSLGLGGEPDPRTWLAPGRRALDERCEAIVPALAERGWSVCWAPHARHVLSDAPSTLSFLRDHAGEPFGLALAPHALFEPSMLRDAEEHLERILTGLAPACDFLVLADVAIDDTGACAPVSLGRGRLPPDALRRLVRAHVTQDVHILFAAGDHDRERAWLEA